MMTGGTPAPDGPADRIARYLILHGRVQGVGLRKCVKAAAEARGVTGWIRNMRAGHVEAFLEGAPENVTRIIADLQLGRMRAALDDCIVNRMDPAGHAEFAILRQSASRAADRDSPAVMLAHARFLSGQFRNLGAYLMRVADRKNGTSLSPDISEIAKEIPSRYLGEPLLQRQPRLPFRVPDVAGSFACEAWAHRIFNAELSRGGAKSAESILDDKGQGQAFMRQLGYRVPETYAVSTPLDMIEPRAGLVVKPVRGASSKGVYSFLSESEIYSLGSNTVLSSFDAFFEDARKTQEKLARTDRWMVEELILNEDGFLPNDLKMLTFYGKVALVQEAARMPTRLCYYDRDGKRIRTGRYEHMAFEGTGLLPEYVEAAEAVSLHIPAPFCRIDFLKAGGGPVFGEFTPKPGNFHQFDAATDAWLGAEFARARARLMADILDGKTFTEFGKFVASLETRARGAGKRGAGKRGAGWPRKARKKRAAAQTG